MNKKQRRLKSRLQSQTSQLERVTAQLEESQRQCHQLQAINSEHRYKTQDLRDHFAWQLARYRWVDMVLDDALREFPGHPLQRLLDTHREMRDPYQYPYWDMAVLPKLLPYGPNGSEQIRDIAVDIVRHYALQYDFRYNEHRGQEYVRLHFNGKGVGYFCPKELRGMPPQEKFNLVMRELTPVVIRLLEND